MSDEVSVADAVANVRDQPGASADPDPAASADPDHVEQAVGEIDAMGDLEDDAIDPVGWLMESPDGSIFDTDVRELWNPDEGGVNRLLLLAEDIAGTDGMPRVGHLLIAVAEIAREMREQSDDESADQGGEWT